MDFGSVAGMNPTWMCRLDKNRSKNNNISKSLKAVYNLLTQNTFRTHQPIEIDYYFRLIKTPMSLKSIWWNGHRVGCSAQLKLDHKQHSETILVLSIQDYRWKDKRYNDSKVANCLYIVYNSICQSVRIQQKQFYKIHLEKVGFLIWEITDYIVIPPSMLLRLEE